MPYEYAHRAPETRKLYLLQLSTTTVPLPQGRSVEMVLPSYLIATADSKRILIDTGMAPDARPSDAPPAENEKNVLQHLSELELHPSDIDTLICTHFDVETWTTADFTTPSQMLNSSSSASTTNSPAAGIHALLTLALAGSIPLRATFSSMATRNFFPALQTGGVLLAIDAVMMQRLFTMDRKAWPKDDNEADLLASTSKLLKCVEREQVQLVVFGHDGEQWKTLKRSPQFYE